MAVPAPAAPSLPPVLALARAAAREAVEVELHASVVHRSPIPTVGLYAGLLALSAWGSALWPAGAVVLFGLVVASALQDLDGRSGVLRRLLVRDPAQSLLAWSTPLRPHGQCLLVLIPSELRSARPSPGVKSLLPLFVIAGLIGVGLPLRWLLPEGAAPLLGWAGAACLVVGLVALVLELMRQRHEPVGSEQLVMGLLRRLRASPTSNVAVAVACVDDGLDHFDGTEILLLNHRPRLDPEHTRVVAWRPSPGPLQQVSSEGRVRKLAPDPSLQRVADELGLPRSPGLTAAGRARALGWPSLGLLGGVDAIDQVADRICALAGALDLRAGGAGASSKDSGEGAT